MVFLEFISNFYDGSVVKNTRFLFHGSTVSVPNPVIYDEYRPMDFGGGFYLTFNPFQALGFSYKVFRVRKKGKPTFNLYEFNKEWLLGLNNYMFNNIDKGWLDIVRDCRRHGDIFVGFDTVYGPVADSRVDEVLEKYDNNRHSWKTAIELLKVKRGYNQIVIKSEIALGSISFIGSIPLEGSRLKESMKNKYRILVDLIEGYSDLKGISTKETFKVFKDTGATDLILDTHDSFSITDKKQNLKELDYYINGGTGGGYLAW